MKWPTIVALPAPAPARPLVVRLMWLAIIWAAGVGCMLVVAVVLRGVLVR